MWHHYRTKSLQSPLKKIPILPIFKAGSESKGHFTYKPRAMTMKFWDPKRKCSKAIPIHSQNYVVWSWALKCSVKSYVTGPSTKCYFNEFLFMWILTHDFIFFKSLNSCPAFGVPWSPTFVLGLPPRGGFWIQSKWPWNMIHLMACRNPCRLYIHLAFAYSVGPSSVVKNELRQAPPFPPLRVLEVQWSRALNLVYELTPKIH